MLSNCHIGDSRFITTGQGGLPQVPWTPTTDPVVWEDIQVPAAPTDVSEQPPQSPSSPQPRLREAQALQFDDQGTPRLAGDRTPQPSLLIPGNPGC